MGETIFIADGERFMPSEHARGPWDPDALHGGAPAALMTAAFERVEPGAELPIARLGFELLRPVPFAPLELTTRIVRAGRRVQELAGELRAGEQLVARASALRVQPVPELPRRPDGAAPEPPMPGPDAATPVSFALAGLDRPNFGATAMEMRWVSERRPSGPARVWMRLRHPLLSGEEPSALARLAASADFGNGISSELAIADYLFINADLTIHLHRPPRGEWIGLDSRTLLSRGGTGLAETVLHDVDGAVGRSFQSLVIQAR